MTAAAVALLVVGSTAIAAAEPVRGTIVDGTTREPVGGAVITAGAELAASADDGTFALELPIGPITLVIDAPWLVTKRVPIVVVRGGIAGLTIEVAEASELKGETVIVEGVAPTAPGETRVDAKTARIVPGGGDAAKVVQSLPAVARPPTGSSEIVVWGAAPRDTRVFVDGVPVSALYHVGGYRSIVGNDLIGDIRLVPAAFGPDRGRAIGGVIDIGLADPDQVPRGRLQADPLDLGAATRLRIGKTVLAGAVRQSWLDRAVDLIADPRELAPNAPLPRWRDGQLIAKSKLRTDLTLTSWLLDSGDTLARTLASDDPATETSQTVDTRMRRAAVTLRRDRPDGFDSATLWFGHDTADDDLRVGLVGANLHQRQLLAGARAIQQSRLGDRVTLTAGLDLDAEHARYDRLGSLSIPAREGDLHIFGQPPGDDVNTDRWFATTIDLAGYTAVDLRLGRVTATLGARGDGWLLGASRLTPKVGTTPSIGSQEMRFTLDPRVAVAVQTTDELLLRLDAGRYHQARAGSDASAVFGTPDLALEEALHATLGGQWKPAKAPVALELVGFVRELDRLVARDLAVTPLFARALTQDGTGNVVGVQLTGRIVGYRGLTGWLSYMLSRSTRRDAPMVEDRLFDHDQTHGLVAVAGYERGAWSVGGRVRVATGEPRTAVLGSFFDSRSGRFQPIRGEHNGVRLPAYVAADLRGERRFGSPGKLAGALYVEVQNLTSRANAEEIIYSADFSQQSYLTGLPLLAIAGGRLEL